MAISGELTLSHHPYWGTLDPLACDYQSLNQWVCEINTSCGAEDEIVFQRFEFFLHFGE